MKRFFNKKGFTTVELMATITISAIVFAVLGVSISAYMNFANFKRQNEYAQTLFVAAQNTLTRFNQNGEDESVIVDLERYNSRRMLSQNMLEGEALDRFEPEDEDRIYYITINKDGTAYSSAATDAEKDYAKELFERLFKDTVYDKSILNNASITVEFDPEQGVVYSVLYSDVREGFKYNNDTDPATDTYTSISNRDEDVRRDLKVGYYGIEDLAAQTSRNKEKPVIENVTLVNSNSLYLTYRLSDKYAAKATGDLFYDIDLYSASSTNTVLMRISVTEPIKALYDNYGETRPYEELKMDCEVTIYDSTDGSATKEVYPFIAFVDNDYRINLYLDSVDLAAKTTAEAVSTTYSIERFGIETNNSGNIYASVRAYGNKYKNSAWRRSNTENMLFATGKVNTNAADVSDYEYEISNARHLYNMRFSEEKLLENDSAKYTVIENFSWAGGASLFNSRYGSEVFKNNQEMPETATDGSKTSFVAIPQLSDQSTLTSTVAILTRKPKTISNLVITSRNSNNIALISQNHGAIQNLILDSPQISGINNVGAYTAVNYGALANLTTTGGSVSGIENVGGIFGKNENILNTYENLHNGSNVKGAYYVGGIVGKIENTSIYDSTNSGLVEASFVNELDQVIGTFTEELVRLAATGVNINFTTSAASMSNATNFINIYKNALGYDFLAMNENDFAAIDQIINIDGLAGIDGYTDAKSLGEAYAWAPILIEDPDGEIVTSDKKYSITFALRAKYDATGNLKSDADFLNAQTGHLVYYKGTYYYNVHTNTNKLTAYSFISTATEAQLFEKSSYTPITGTVNSTTEHRTFSEEPSYIGGITGYIANGKLVNCTSTNSTTNAYIENLLEDNYKYYDEDQQGGAPILGVYVGGIAGFVEDSASLQDCSTLGGYVIGSNYVGGIVGFSNATSFINSGSTNKANVVGNYYVGGIIGANAKDSGNNDENGFIQVEEDVISENTIENALNKGFVIAAKGYGGGITGYNTGIIQNSGSDVDESTFFNKLTESREKYSGDYIGGLVGYNSGQVTCVASSRNKTMTSYVFGNNYVGGIVGLNSNNSDVMLTGYRYSGGRVYGNNFVGGYVGLNLSTSLLMDSDGNAITLTASPNLVSGNYYVSGVIGGNIIKNTGTDNVYANFTTNNFLGKIEAKAFVGGLVGYNLVAYTDDFDIKANYTFLASNDKTELKQAVEYVESVTLGTMTGLEPDLVIGSEDASNLTLNRFEGIYGDIYVGGVLGYNASRSVVEIRNVENRTPIFANSSIVVAELTGEDNYDVYNNSQEKEYSYAGGIVGKCTPDMVLNNCSGSSASRVVSNGTYLGGLVEVNEGVIENCDAVTIGDIFTNYVGGMVGLNKSNAYVNSPNLNSKTVVGKNVVGGIVADNFGSIEGNNVTITGTINGNGQNVGGITGINNTTATVQNFNIDVNIGGNGENVGGAVGTNKGALSTVTGVDNSRTVIGNATVGGIVGLNATTTTLTSAKNYSDVTSNYGYVGGIVGLSQSGNITNSLNEGKVLVLGSANSINSSAGGIVGGVDTKVNTLTISQNTNTNYIEATKGYAGGIVGIVTKNDKTVSISNCTNSGAGILGSKYAGGIAAFVDATISDCTVKGTDVTNATATGSFLGGVVGFSFRNLTGNDVEDSVVTAKANDVTMGGVVGAVDENSTIVIEDSTIKGSTLKFTTYGTTNYGYIGGVIGLNTATVKDCTFDSSKILGGSNNPENSPKYSLTADYESTGAITYGYGGIAGVNGHIVPSTGAVIAAGTIENCVIKDADIRATGDDNNIATIGGVAGVNNKNSSINNISYTGQTLIYSTTSETATTGANTNTFAYIGGVTGYNYGLVSHIGKEREEDFNSTDQATKQTARINSKDDTSVVKVYASKGHNSGIVGFNKSTGVISYAATGSKWQITSYSHSQDNGTAGIIGYNNAATEITYCDNWATITKTASGSNVVGGIIGRNEVASSSAWAVINCVNFGNVNGGSGSDSGVTAGIIARLKYRGGTITDCDNYGEILNTSIQSAGIVANLYALSTGDTTYILNCNNYGSIRAGESAGGILAQLQANSSGAHVFIANCTNTGIITSSGNSTSSGIMQNSKISSNAGSKITIQDCKNYYSTGNTFYGILSSALAAPQITLRNNYSLSGYIAPSNIVDVASDNYTFYKDTSVTGISSMTTNVVGDNVTGDTTAKAENVINGALKETANSETFSVADAQSVEFVFNFNEMINLNSVELFPVFDANGSYKMTIYYYDETSSGYVELNNTFAESFKTQDDTNYTTSQNSVTYNGFTVASENGTVKTKKVKVLVEYSDLVTPGDSGTIELLEIGFNGTVKAWKQAAHKAATIVGVGEALGLRQQGTSTVYNAVKGTDKIEFILDMDFKTTYENFLNDKTNSLVVKGALANNARQETYLSIDTNIVNAGDEAPPAPVDENTIKVTDLGGSVEFNWNVPANAYRYKVEVSVLNSAGEVEDTYTTNVYDSRIEIPTANREGKVITVNITSLGKKDSEATSSAQATYTVPDTTLPIPQVKFILTDINTTNTYRITIENAQDYIQYGGAEVVVTYNTKTVTLKVDQQGNYTVSNVAGLGTTDNYLVTVQAKPAAGQSHGLSGVDRRESHIPKNSTWKSSQVGLVDFKNGTNYGFLGITPETLSYSLAIKPNGYTLIYRSELVATDTTNGLGIPMVYSSSIAYASTTNNKYNANLITNLPIDITDASKYSYVTVRSYPIAASNEVVLTGRTVIENITKAELQALKVNDIGQIDANGTALINGTTLKDGYVVFYNDEDNYSVVYNALLRSNSNSVNVRTVGNDVRDGIQIQPAPELNVNYNDVASSYVATFDVNDDGTAKYVSAGYSYTLTGTTLDGISVVIAENENVVAVTNGSSNVINLNTETWNYSSVELVVSRKGTVVGTTQRTATFGSSSTEVTATKVSLRQIVAPIVSINGNDDWNFNISWSGISVAESDYYANTSHYRVEGTAYVDVDSNGTSELVAFAYETPDKITNNLYIDFENLQYTYQGVAYTGGVVESNTDIQISVRAIATNNNTYGNGPQGLTYLLQIEARLETPDTSGDLLKFIEKFQLNQDGSASVLDFEGKGFEIKYNGTNTPNAEVFGKYQVAVSIIDKDNLDAQGNPTVLAEIAPKADPILLEGTRLDEEVSSIIDVTDGLLADYSNKTVSISIRANSDTEFKSRWSDAVEFDLPQIQVDYIDVLHAFNTLTLEKSIYQQGTEYNNYKVNVDQKVLEWTQERFINGYSLALLKESVPEDTVDGKYDYFKIDFDDQQAYDAITEEPKLSYYTFVDDDGDIDTENVYVETVITASKEVDDATNVTTYTFELPDEYNKEHPIVDINGNQLNQTSLIIDSKLVIKITGEEVVNPDDATTKKVISKVDYQLYLPDVYIPATTNVPYSVAQNYMFTDTLVMRANAYNEDYIDSLLSAIKRAGVTPYDFETVAEDDIPQDIIFPEPDDGSGNP